MHSLVKMKCLLQLKVFFPFVIKVMLLDNCIIVVCYRIIWCLNIHIQFSNTFTRVNDHNSANKLHALYYYCSICAKTYY